MSNTRMLPTPAAMARPVQGERPVVQIELDVPVRLLLAAQCGLPFVPNEIRQKMSSMLSYETMAIVAGSIAVLIGAHAVGVGFAVDIVLGVFTVAVVGMESVEAARHLTRFHALAMAARYKQDFEAAGREFALFVTTVGINVVLISLMKVNLKQVPVMKPFDKRLIATGWAAYIDRLNLRVPRDQGILWSKIGMQQAESIAHSKGLISLEMLLKREGFLEAYSRQFGTFENVKAAGLQNVTGEIWRGVSRRYAAGLEGKVTAFVDNKLLRSAISKSDEPVLVDELWEIAEMMQANPNINSVQMVDISTGKSWLMLREHVLKSAARRH